MPLHDWSAVPGWDGVHQVWGVELLYAIKPLLPPAYRAYSSTDILSGAQLFFDDMEVPTVTSASSPPSGWASHASGALTVTGTDPGVGVNVWTGGPGVAIAAPGYVPLCGPGLYAYDRYGRCRASDTRDFAFDTDLMPEGSSNLTVTATDVLNKSGSKAWPGARAARIRSR